MKFFNYKLGLLFLSFFCTSLVNANHKTEMQDNMSRSDIFPPPDGKLLPLKGKIINGRYYAPNNLFSCLAEDFGEESYLAQDGNPLETGAVVGFYNSMGDFMKVEVFVFPGLEKKGLNEQLLKDAFEGFGIRILKQVDNAQGLEILEEKIIGDMLFVTLSIDKMDVLRSTDGYYKSSTRGYLIFQDKEKLVILTNQKVTWPRATHRPREQMEKIKQDVLNFKKTLEFDCNP